MRRRSRVGVLWLLRWLKYLSLSHVVMMTCGGCADSDGGQEVEMENKSTEETYY